MKKGLREKIRRVGGVLYFSGALFFLVFLLGLYLGKKDPRPVQVFHQAGLAVREGVKMVREILPMLSGDPADHTHVFLDAEAPAVQGGAQEDGYIFLAGYQPGRRWFRLIDRAGRVHWEWTIPEAVYDAVAEQSGWVVKRSFFFVHGSKLLEDGGVVFNIQRVLAARMDACGDLGWILREPAHHAVSLAPDENFLIPGTVSYFEESPYPHVTSPFREDEILKVSRSGQVLKRFAFIREAFRSRYEGLVMEGGQIYPETRDPDPLHLNDVVSVPPRAAARHPLFETGDLLVSMRRLDALAVMDGHTGAVKWALSGPFLRQHDPEFTAEGTIMVFDNRTDEGKPIFRRSITRPQAFGYSRIIEVDPLTHEILWEFRGSEDFPFYASIQGKIDILPNGNILVADPEHGRVFEIDKATKEVVWQYRNRLEFPDHPPPEGDAYYGRVTEARYVPLESVKFLEKTCP